MQPPSAGQAVGLIEGVGSPEAIVRHFKNVLLYIQEKRRESQDSFTNRFEDVDVAGPCLKLGLPVQ